MSNIPAASVNIRHVKVIDAKNVDYSSTDVSSYTHFDGSTGVTSNTTHHSYQKVWVRDMDTGNEKELVPLVRVRNGQELLMAYDDNLGYCVKMTNLNSGEEGYYISDADKQGYGGKMGNIGLLMCIPAFNVMVAIAFALGWIISLFARDPKKYFVIRHFNPVTLRYLLIVSAGGALVNFSLYLMAEEGAVIGILALLAGAFMAIKGNAGPVKRQQKRFMEYVGQIDQAMEKAKASVQRKSAA
jgi:hypothetical protein